MISVLYVDDEPDLLDLGRLFLERDGMFQITAAESGLLALDILNKKSFDAVVSDFQMPEMDGIALLRRIRSTSDIPFILFTGKGREEVVIDAINSGADFYLQKGGDTQAQYAELGHKIVQAVSRKRAERALRTQLELVRQTAITSARLIRMTGNTIDEAVSRTLAEIGRHYHADHCCIVQSYGTDATAAFTHEWADTGIVPLLEVPATFRTTDYPWISGRIQALEVINIPKIAAHGSLPDTAGRERAWLQDRGIQSLLILPLSIGPSITGALYLDAVTREVTWPEEELDILKIHGQIISSALARKAADRAMQESEKLYRTVFEATGTGMMILEEDKTISVVNREIERISGFSREDIEGKMLWTRFVSPDDIERMKHYHELRRSDPLSVPKNYEFVFLGQDGRQIGTYITVEMIPGTKRSVVSLIDISREIQARQELADSEEKFRGLTESLPEGIYMIQDNRFVYVNPAFAKMFGYTTEELLALPDFIDIFPDDVRPRIRTAVADRLVGIRDSERYKTRGIHKDGTPISIVIHGSKTRYRGRPAIIGTITEGWE